MIIQFPTTQPPDPQLRAMTAMVGLCIRLSFWWIPATPSVVVSLDEYRFLKDRRRINAAKRAG
jgi:hypothetical protein